MCIGEAAVYGLAKKIVSNSILGCGEFAALVKFKMVVLTKDSWRSRLAFSNLGVASETGVVAFVKSSLNWSRVVYTLMLVDDLGDVTFVWIVILV